MTGSLAITCRITCTHLEEVKGSALEFLPHVVELWYGLLKLLPICRWHLIVKWIILISSYILLLFCWPPNAKFMAVTKMKVKLVHFIPVYPINSSSMTWIHLLDTSKNEHKYNILDQILINPMLTQQWERTSGRGLQNIVIQKNSQYFTIIHIIYNPDKNFSRPFFKLIKWF